MARETVVRDSPSPRQRASYIAARIKDKTRNFCRKLLVHLPYNTDFAASDYYLFLHLKQWLDGQRFENDEELKTTVINWFNS